MRKYAALVAFFLLLAAPMVMRGFSRNSSSDVQVGSARLVVITPHNEDIRNEFRWAFSDWHQKKYGEPVELDFLVPGGTSDVKRQLDSLYRTIRAAHGGSLPPEDQVDSNIQIAWGGGDQFFDRELKPLGILRPLDLDEKKLAEIYPQITLSGGYLYDQEKDASGNKLPPKWAGVCLSSFGIFYNVDLCAALGMSPPATWTDLTDPRYVGALALADPSHSGTAAVADMMVLQRAMADAEQDFFNQPANHGKSAVDLKKLPAYQTALDEGWKIGMRRLTLIAANARYFTYDSPRVPTDVSMGQAAAGMAIDFYGRVTEETVGGQRVQFVTPQAATAITPDPVAILYGTHGPKLDLANHFVEFLLSPEGQRLWILKVGQPGGPRRHALRRPPVRRDVYADRTGWSDDIDSFALAGGFQQRNEWMAMLNQLRPIWTAAWIDDADDLRAAYRKVLGVPDPARRAQLLEELADLPVTRAEVLPRPVQVDKSVDPDMAKARERLSWAQKCRDHYQHVADEVGGS